MRRDIHMIIEELSLDGEISIGRCCKQTMRNWVKNINELLISSKYDWRVVGHMEDGCGIISSIPKERYDIIISL